MKYSQAAFVSLLAVVVAGCSTLPIGHSSRSKVNVEDLFTSDESVITSNKAEAAPVNDTGLRIRKSERGNMKSYVVRGQRYHTIEESDGYSARGLASWYGPNFHGQVASNGETYDMYKMTAAHKTLPLPTYVRVTHMDNGKSVVVKINDRGPFSGDRIIDLSFAAALQLGMVNDGTAMVDIEALTAQEVAQLSGPDNSLGVDFYTDEQVAVAAVTEAESMVTPDTPATAANSGSALQLPPVPTSDPVTQGIAVQVEQPPALDGKNVTVSDLDDGELLSLDSLESEMAAAEAASIRKPSVGADEIEVLVNAEATTDVRRAAGLPVDVVDNVSAAGQPVTLSSIGAVQTAKTGTDQRSANAPEQSVAIADAQVPSRPLGESVAVPGQNVAVPGQDVAVLPGQDVAVLPGQNVAVLSGQNDSGADQNVAAEPGYFIQAGVFANVKDAEKVAVEVVLAVPLEEVHVKPLKGSEMYRITVGPIIASDHAAEVSGKLDDAGVENFTVKVKSIL